MISYFKDTRFLIVNFIARGFDFLAAAGYTCNTVCYSTNQHELILSVKDSRSLTPDPNSKFILVHRHMGRDVFVQKNDLRASYQFCQFDGFDEAIIRTWSNVITQLCSCLPGSIPIVFDIGANYGAYSLGVDALGITLVLVEPNPMISICLEKTYPNAYIFSKALVAENSCQARIELNMSPVASGGSSLCDLHNDASTENLAFSFYCQTLKPSELFSVCGDANCAFIKLDVEGYEPVLFRSGLMDQISFRYPNFVIMVEFFRTILSIDDQNYLLDLIGDYPCLILDQLHQDCDDRLQDELRRQPSSSQNKQSIYRYFGDNLSISRHQLRANLTDSMYADIIVFSNKSLLKLLY